MEFISVTSHVFPSSVIDQCNSDVDVIGKVVTNTRSEAAVSVRCWAELYSIPPLSSFLLSDIRKLSVLVDHTGMYMYSQVCQGCEVGRICTCIHI